MNEKTVCEAILYAYKDLERMGEAVEEQAMRCAIGSRNRDIFECADELTRLTNEKIAYCNAKVIIDKAIKQMSRCDEIKAFHIQGLQCKDIAEQGNVTIDTVLKRLSRQRQRLYQIIIGSNKAEDLRQIIRDSKWLTGRHKAILKAQSKEAKANGKD